MNIAPEDVVSVYNSSKLTDICGIGYGISKRLNQMGIYTLIQLRLAPRSALIAAFGDVCGKHLHDISMGIDLRPVVSYTEETTVKSVSRNYCLPENEYDQRKILQTLYELCEEVAIKLRRLHKKARTVGIYLGGDKRIQGRQTFSEYFDNGKDIYDACMLIMNQEVRIKNYGTQGTIPLIHNSFFIIQNYVRQISITVSSLEDEKYVPSPLLPADQKKQRLTHIIDQLNDKFGDHTIRNGFLLYSDKLTTVPNGWLADRYERTKLSSMT